MAAVEATMCYLCQYPSTGLYFVEGEESNLLGFSNIDFAHVLDDRIFTGAYIFVLGTTPVSWSSKKQTTTTRSSCGAEYRALSNCNCEAIWFWKPLT
jgi:histone deacetylase 1/2